jgi:hypothetical protein
MAISCRRTGQNVLSTGLSLGGIAARPKFLAEVDIDHRHPGLAELGIEMLESGRHLAGRDRGDLRLAQICGPNGPPSPATAWFWPCGAAAFSAPADRFSAARWP